MNLKEFFSSRKYLSKLFIWLTSAIVLIVIILTAVVYFTVQQIFMKNEIETSKKVLSQVKFNIEFVDQTIRSISNYLFVNPNISSILNGSTGSELGLNTLYTTLHNVINPTLLSNGYIHSICLYNSSNEQYYYVGKSLFFDDKVLKDIIGKYPDVPKQKPIFRKIANEYGKAEAHENVITYMMYETGGTPKKIDSGIIINIRPEWLLDNIASINMVEKNKGDQIYILDEEGRFIENKSNDETFKQSLFDEFIKIKKTGKDATGFFHISVMKERYVVTYNQIKSIGLTLLKVQPEKVVYKNINILRNSIVITAIIILMLSIIISIAVSNKLYKPLGKLVKQVETNKNKAFVRDSKDEISYLNNIYNYSMEQLNNYDREKIKNRSILKVYWLKKFLTEGKRIEKGQFENICSENMINLPYEGDFTVCVLKIDNSNEFRRVNDSKDREIIRFAIINIMTELLSERFAADCVEMGEDQVVAVVSLKPATENYIEEIEVRIKQAQDYLLKHFNVSVTASVGKKVDALWRLPESYENALENSMYRFVLGRTSIIVPENIKQNCSNTNCEYSAKLEARLIENIKAGKPEGVEECLQDILSEISTFNYDNIVLAIINLVDSVKKAIEDVAKIGGKSAKFNFIDVKRLVYELETQGEFFELFLASVKNAMREPSENVSDLKYASISETAIDIINKNYSDSALCQNQIADMLKTSSRQLARIFKDVTGMSIPDFISDIRLKKAAELLEHSHMNVYEVIQKIGFDNESYFYRMFKRKYGYTPKEYAILKNIDNE